MQTMFDLRIRISSNFTTEEEVMVKFEKWLDTCRCRGEKETSLWYGQSCIIEYEVIKVVE